MKKLLCSFLLCLTIIGSRAQTLKQTSLIVSKDKPYFGLFAERAFTKQEATTSAGAVDLLYEETAYGKDIERSFYNVSDKSGKAAGMESDKPVMIAGLSWDRDTFNSCKTVADFKRMTTNITNNSFSFFATIANNATGDINYPCFIVQLNNGKRGILFVSRENDREIHVDAKMQP